MLQPGGTFVRALMQGTKNKDETITPATTTGNGTAMTVTSTDDAYSLHTVQIVGITTATVTFEAYTDEVPTWVAIHYTNLANPTATATTATADGIYQCTKPVSGLLKVRARISAYSSGNVVVWGVLKA